MSGPSMVEMAVACLRAYGGRLSRPQAHRVLRHWKHYRRLTPAEVARVLASFRQVSR